MVAAKRTNPVGPWKTAWLAMTVAAALSAPICVVAQQVPDFEQRLQKIEQRLGIQPGGGSQEERLTAIEKKLAELEQAKAPGAAMSPAGQPAAVKAEGAYVEAGKNGFIIKSADGNNKLKVGGYIQADARVAAGDDEKIFTNTFVVRRIRPTIEGTVAKDFDFRWSQEFGYGKSTLMDGYVDWRVAKAFALRAGKYKSPEGLEMLQSDQYLPFAERPLSTNNLLPSRAIGFMGHGSVADGLFSYQAGVFNSAEDGSNNDFDTADDKEFAGRVFFHPFKKSGPEGLKGLGIGYNFTFFNTKGKLAAPKLGTYKAVSNLAFFSYRYDGKTADGTVIADGAHRRWSPQMYYYYKGFGFMGEYIRSSQEVRIGGALNCQTEYLSNSGWETTASYCFGGDASYKGTKVHRPFDPKHGNWGALEFAARYNMISVDPDTFPVFANPDTAAQKAKSWTVGANWYLNENFRLQLNYDYTRFVGGAPNGENRNSERIWIARFQIIF